MKQIDHRALPGEVIHERGQVGAIATSVPNVIY